MKVDEFLQLYGGEATASELRGYLCEDMLNVIRNSERDLNRCLPATPEQWRFRVCVVRSTSFVAASYRTSDNRLLVVISLGLVARMTTFLKLALQHDGQYSPLRFMDTDIPDRERHSAELPRALKSIACESRDDLAFWEELEQINGAITRQYECLPQIVTVLIQFLICHEFQHLVNHHHCFLKSLTPDNQLDETSARVSLEIVADTQAARMLSVGLIEVGRQVGVIAPLFGFASYGISAYFLLTDLWRTLVAGWKVSAIPYVHPHLRGCIASDEFRKAVELAQPEEATECFEACNAAWQELVENLNMMVTQFIANGEMTMNDALRLPCLNLFAGSLQVAQNFSGMVLQMNEIYDRCNQVEKYLGAFLESHRTTCYP